jgi:hypothetical protein
MLTTGGTPEYFAGHCIHCGNIHIGICPRIKAIHYRRDGSVERIEYHEAQEGCFQESLPPMTTGGHPPI